MSVLPRTPLEVVEPICPVCGQPAGRVQERIEPVRNPETGRNHGWSRSILTYVHTAPQGASEHRVPGGPVFEQT